MSDPTPRDRREATWRLACRIAVAAVLVGVFVTWVADGPVRLDGTQGPNNGWLAAIVAVLALLWLRLLGSWPGVIGVLGTGLVIGWTALENWLDARATLGASAGPGLVLVVAASVALAAVGARSGRRAGAGGAQAPGGRTRRVTAWARRSAPDEPAVELDAAEYAERDRGDRPDHREDVGA